jgi:hypothetical protein
MQDIVKGKKLDKITDTEMEDIIKNFLWYWGRMWRVVQQNEKWKIGLSEKISGHSDILEKFSKKNLINVNISEFESDIENLYDDFRKVIKQIATAKVLHLICPDFFPLWDNAIAKGIGIKKFSGKDYYGFMQKIQSFTIKHKIILSDLAKQYEKTKLKIVDDFLWLAANESLFLFFDK